MMSAQCQNHCHIVLNDALSGLPAAVAGIAEANLLVPEEYLLNGISGFPGAPAKLVAQQIGIAASAGAAGEDQYILTHGTHSFYGIDKHSVPSGSCYRSRGIFAKFGGGKLCRIDPAAAAIHHTENSNSLWRNRHISERKDAKSVSW